MEIACLYAIGRKRRILMKNRGKNSKSRNSNKIYNYYKKKGHIKECFKLQNRENKFGNKQGEESGEAIVLWNQIKLMENFWLHKMLFQELVRIGF